MGKIKFSKFPPDFVSLQYDFTHNLNTDNQTIELVANFFKTANNTQQCVLQGVSKPGGKF